MATSTIKTSPHIYARIGGILYLLIIVGGILLPILVSVRLVAPGSAVSTAQNIVASPSLWRIGITGDIVIHVLDLPLMVVLYVLLKPINKSLAFLAVFFNLIQTAVLVANTLNLVMPMLLLGNGNYLKVFESDQLYALAYLFVEAYDYGTLIGLIFFGFACLVYGYLLFKSGYFPKPLGVLMTIAGLSYLANSLTHILVPAYAEKIGMVLVLALIGELSFCLWLLMKGVNVPEWEKRILASA
jgi:uncharacterized protein DUF4386